MATIKEQAADIISESASTRRPDLIKEGMLAASMRASENLASLQKEAQASGDPESYRDRLQVLWDRREDAIAAMNSPTERELEQDALRDRDALEKKAAIASEVGTEEEKIKANQDLLRLGGLEQAVEGQIEADILAQRTIFREQQAVQRAGTELNLQGDEILRQQSLLEQNLKQSTQQLDFGMGQLTRQAGSIRRQGALAARAGDQEAAMAANLAAQTGLGGSALRATATSAKSRAATQAGDTLTGLVDVQGRQDLLSTQRDTLNLEASSGRAALEAAGTRLDLSRQQLAGTREDLLSDKTRLQNRLSDNLDFLTSTFDLGGDISVAQQNIVNKQTADAKRAQERADTLGNITTGASLGSAFGPGGMVVGAGIGAVLSLI